MNDKSMPQTTVVSPAFKGSVPVAPDAVRIWRGFRPSEAQLPWKDFLAFLSGTLFPTEGTWRPYFGLTCYIAGIKSPTESAQAPDEFALVFYESQEVYDAGLRTVAGSIYPLFPAAKFATEGGRSGYPDRLQGTFVKNTPYFVLGNQVDWYHGTVRCLMGTLREGEDVDKLCAQVLSALESVQASPPAGLDGLIAMVDESPSGGGYLLCWEHWADGATPPAQPIAGLAELVHVVFRKDAAEPMSVTGGFYDAGVGVEPALTGDQLLRLQFLRRRLAVENGRPVGGPLPAP